MENNTILSQTNIRNQVKEYQAFVQIYRANAVTQKNESMQATQGS